MPEHIIAMIPVGYVSRTLGPYVPAPDRTITTCDSCGVEAYIGPDQLRYMSEHRCRKQCLTCIVPEIEPDGANIQTLEGVYSN